MFDIGATELLVIGVVALIVVGPKDLPGMFRTLGRFTGKAKAMARDFQRAMDDAADEAGVKEVKDSIRAATNPKAMGMDALKGATSGWTSGLDKNDRGPETTKLTEDRAAAAEKIRDATAKKATERLEAEAAAKAAETKPAAKPKPKAKKAAAKKPATKPAAKKKPAAKPAAAKKSAVAKKTAAKKPSAKKPATKAKPKDAAK